MKAWWLRLGRYALPYRNGLSSILLLMLVGVGLDVLNPWPLKLIVDHVLVNQPLPAAVIWLKTLPGAESPTGLLGWLAGGTILLFLARQVVSIIQTYIQTGVGQQIKYDLGASLFEHIQRLSLRFHTQQHTGDLVRRVTTDSNSVQGLIMGVVLPVLTSLVSLATMFTVMWQLDPLLSLIALLAAPLCVVLIRVFNQPMMERNYQHQQLEGQMMALTERTLTALPIVQGFNREDLEDQHFRNLSRQAFHAYWRATSSQVQFKVGVGAVTAVGIAATMLIGGFQVLAGALSVGSLLIFLNYLVSLYAPLEMLAYTSSGYATAAASARRVLEGLDAQDSVRDVPGAKPLTTITQPRGQVCFEQVTFGYDPDHPVLNDISLHANPGETIAIIGSTGAGKSTLVSLIPRFFDPCQGRILFDGVDVRQVQLKSLRSQIALVLQEPFLLPLTIAENIAYGRPHASDEEIVTAAKAARADEFIQRLSQGYSTVVGERGATLSGGEKQRLAIARALLKDAPVLILDEPTSALDAYTEALLLEALERLMAGRTTFLIAHRLSTIRQANRIVVLERGRVVERGTHQELLAGRGHYYKLYRAQFDTAPVM